MDSNSSSEELRKKADKFQNSHKTLQVTTEELNERITAFKDHCSRIGDVINPIVDSTSAIRRNHEDVLTAKYLEKLPSIISSFSYIREAEKIICKGPTEDFNGFLEAFDKLISIKKYETNESANKDADRLVGDAIEKMKDEFNKILIDHRKMVDRESLFDGSEVPLCKFIPQLNNLAVRLVLEEDSTQWCLAIYRDARANALQQTLHDFGVPNITNDELQKMQWETLKAKISDWIEVIQRSVMVLFPGERKLCDDVFRGTPKTFLDRCFMETTSSSLALLRSFLEAIADIQTSPDKLFELLNLYETICKLQPEMEVMFVSTECNEMMHWFNVRKQLVTMSAKTFLDYWEVVEMDTSKPLKNGSVNLHSIRTMNYIKSLFNSKAILIKLLEEYNTEDQEEDFQFGPSILKILKSLQINMESKSGAYKYPGQWNFFMMNNVHYMVTSVREDAAAKEFLGDGWFEERNVLAEVYARQYESIAWAEVLGCLQVQSPSEESSNKFPPKGVIKDRLNTFNMQFEKQCLRQRLWEIHDPMLCKDVRGSVSQLLVSAYTLFIEKLSSESSHYHKWMKYSIEDIQKELEKLFDGERPG